MTAREWAAVVGAALVFVGTVTASAITVRGALRAANTTREVGLATVHATREDNFIDQLRARLTDVERSAEQSAERVESQRRVIYKLQDRVVVLERVSVRDRELIQQLRQFISALLRAWPKPGEEVPPAPQAPPGLLDGTDDD